MPDDPRSRFAPVAANYSRAKFHTAPDRLEEVVDLVRPLRGDLALDVATGTGNTAFALAPLVRRVVYVVRAAPHHFHDIDAFLEEAYRVLRPGRDAAFIDCAPPSPARDVLHEVEVRRDPSHVMSLTVDEWRMRLERAGFEVEMARARELDWDYEEWMHTMAVDRELAAELATVIESAQGEARAQLHPERRDGKLWHAYWHCLIRAHKPE